MNDTTKVDQVNQLVRAICVLVLLGAFVTAFLVGVWRDKPVVSVDGFIGILTLALTWWFKSRDEQQRQREGSTPEPGRTP
jgi:hypothetical protein